jgi:hypothetical protein
VNLLVFAPQLFVVILNSPVDFPALGRLDWGHRRADQPTQRFSFPSSSLSLPASFGTKLMLTSLRKSGWWREKQVEPVGTAARANHERRGETRAADAQAASMRLGRAIKRLVSFFENS